MALVIFILFAVTFCLAILIGISLAEQAMTARGRQQAEQQRLLNSRWDALRAREELHQLFSQARRQLQDDVAYPRSAGSSRWPER